MTPQLSQPSYLVGTRCNYRTVFGNVWTVRVKKTFLFMRLVEWTRETTDLSNYTWESKKIGWKPVWRLYE